MLTSHAVLILIAGAAACLAQDSALPIMAVKDAPFSAKAVTESTQVLADGNRIVRSSTALIVRDSEGRSRREQNLTATRSVVFLLDPVAAAAYILDTASRSGRRMTISPLAASGVDTLPDEPNIKTEPLGTQVIEGLITEGTRLTRQFPEGKAGNDRAFEVVSEIWYSKELQTIALSKTSDPRSGETTYRLTDIQRVEPLPSLFEVPSDYRIAAESTNVWH